VLASRSASTKPKSRLTAQRPIVGMAQTSDMVSAVNEALDHLQKQALKYKTKWLSKKRKAVKKFDSQSLEDNIGAALGLRRTLLFPFSFTSFHPSRGPQKCISCMPRTRRAPSADLEEAIKEAHFRDKDVFVFRDPQGKLMVLHRTRDGKMELIEAP